MRPADGRFTLAGVRPCTLAVLVACASCASSSGSTGPGQTDAGGQDGPSSEAGAGTALSPSADGPSQCNGSGLADGGACPARTPGTTTIIGSTYASNGSAITYGTAPDMWDVWAFAAAGEPAPAIVPSASAISISAALAAGGGPVGLGVSVHGPQCFNETNFARGLAFTLAGSLGGCSLYLDVIGSTDQSSQLDTCRGACAGDPASCTPATVQITEMGNVSVANMSFYGGSPNPAPDLTKAIGFRWRLAAPSGNAGCSAQLTIGNVQLVGP